MVRVAGADSLKEVDWQALYDEHKSERKVADAVGITRSTARYHLNRAGVVRRTWGANQYGDAPEAAPKSLTAETDGFKDRVFDFLRKPAHRNGIRLVDVADFFDVAPKVIREVAHELSEEGNSVYHVGDILSTSATASNEKQVIPDLEPMDTVYIGVISDTHYGSKHQQPTNLREFMFRMADKYPLACWLHCGDWTDGVPEVYRGHMHEVWITRGDEQAEYAAMTYPDTGVKTYGIAGNHDGSAEKKAGIDVVKMIADRRDDVEHLGFYNRFIEVAGLDFNLWHPDGGIPYSMSYRPQTRIAQYGRTEAPQFLLAGHLHQFVHVWMRGVHGFLVPSWQATTQYISRKGGTSMVGGMVLEVTRDKYGMPTYVKPDVGVFAPIENDYERLAF